MSVKGGKQALMTIHETIVYSAKTRRRKMKHMHSFIRLHTDSITAHKKKIMSHM
jgi:hypothetical protein